MKLKVTRYAANRRQAKKAAKAASGRGFIAYKISDQYYELFKYRDGDVEIMRMDGRRTPMAYHWSQLEDGWLQ